MSYTPVELRHVRVGRSLFGYNRAMVEQVIEEVAESFEATWRERGELADRLESLEKQLEELRGREALLTQTLIAAEQAASDVRERARHEAETIVTEAHNEARAIGRAAQADRERLVTESRRIEGMLRAALDLVGERSAVADEPQSPPAASAPDPASMVSTPLTSVPDAAPSGPEEPPAATWAREDTREFEPIAPAEAEPADPPEPDRPEEPRAGTESGELWAPLEPVSQLPGSESRGDFDWGE